MKTYKIFGATVIVFSAVLALTIGSCSAEQTAAYKNRSGAQLWGENCIRCHNTPSPASYNDTDWETISLHMKVRANLTDDQAGKIFEFIKSAN
ncbi:MAG TPA: cytochrome c [Flavobacteriaceae bacterium]|nr:cytochrome c [Flavobacteriaceae bacterium]